MNKHVFDRSGLPSREDLHVPAARELFAALEREQEAFLELEARFAVSATRGPQPLAPMPVGWEDSTGRTTGTEPEDHEFARKMSAPRPSLFLSFSRFLPLRDRHGG